MCFIGYSFILRCFFFNFWVFWLKDSKISMNYHQKFVQIKKWSFTKKNMDLFLAQICMFITSQNTLENYISFEQIFFNTSLIVSQKHKCISILVLIVLNFKNASLLYIHLIYNFFSGPNQVLVTIQNQIKDQNSWEIQTLVSNFVCIGEFILHST